MYYNGTKSCVLVLCSFLSLSVMAKEEKTMIGQGLQKPLCFIENKGQITDGGNSRRGDIRYQLHTSGMSLYIGNGRLHYQFKKIEGSVNDQKISSYGMDVTFLGANPAARAVSCEQQAYYENYYTGSSANGAVTAHSFNKIVYKDIYPNIDWQLYVKDNQVEYDFVVRPGGNIHDIKLQYDGASALSIAKDGGISAETPLGNVKEKTPYSYETVSGKAVASKFVLHGNVVSFEAGSYNGSLTIDPFLLWSTYFGGANEDVITSVKEGPAGETYVAGYTSSSGISTLGPSWGTATYEGFLTKYNAAGSRLFTTYIGSSASGKTTKCTGIALDNTGANLFLGGYTNASGLPATLIPYNALNDGFVVKFSNTGTVAWSTYLGGAKDDNVNAIACDASNNVYITGQTASTTGIASGGSYQASLKGINDAFVAKMNGASGAKTWCTYYGGTAQEEAFGIALDASSNVLITGQTNSIIDIATAGAHQTTLVGTNDAFIAEISSSGASLIWGTYFGGSGQDQGNGVVCNKATGEIAVVGNTTSPDKISGSKSFQSIYGGGPQDAFIAYLNGSGNLMWSTYYGGAQPDYGQAVCLDNSGNIVITGGTFSLSAIAFPNALQPAIGGDYDAYLAKFLPSGQRLWSTYFGGLYYDYANAVDCDNNNQLTIAGYTTSLGLYGSAGIATAGATQAANAGGTYDGFVTKFKIDTFLQVAQPFIDTLVCAGGTLNVNYISNFDFQPTNTFTVQLSDKTGSFAAPVVIGSAASIPFTTSGTITCVIPSGVTIGKGYRVRIVASDPAYTSPDNFRDIDIESSIPATTVTGSSPICVGNNISLSDAATYQVTGWSWAGPSGSGFGGTGFTSSLQNPVNTGFFGTGVTKADSGIYTVTTSHNGCPDITSTISIMVNDNPPPTPILTSAAHGCLGTGITLFANPDTTAPGITYTWIGSEGFSSTLRNPVTLPITGTGTHTYMLTDYIGGCYATNTINVMVFDTIHVSVSITATPGDTICKGTNVTFKATSVNGGVSPIYQWMSGTGSPITGAVSSVFSTSSLLDGETIFCVMNSSVLCPSPANDPSNVIKMNVISNPPVVKIFSSSPNVKAGDSVSFTSLIYNGGTSPLYQWMRNGKNIPGATSNVYVLKNVNKTDTITLELTSTMLCAIPDFGISNPVVVGTNVGVANIAASLSNVQLFPNPNNGSFTIKGDYENSNSNTVSVEVLNPIGQVILRDKAQVQNNAINKSVDIKNIPDGIYLLRVSDNTQSKTLRFTVKR
jgi:hypothetical protein